MTDRVYMCRYIAVYCYIKYVLVVGRDKFNLLSKSLVNGLFLCCIGPKDSKNTKFISMGPLFLGATIFLCIQFFQKIVKLRYIYTFYVKMLNIH